MKNYEERLNRYKKVTELKDSGYTYREIGEKYGLTRQRVEQIYNGSVPILRVYNVKLLKMSGRDYAREKVRIRDNHTCQSCSKFWTEGQRRFDVHHLRGLCGKKSRGYDSVNDLHLLTTLCHKCHFNHPQHSRLNR